jgi:hypothetical protein
VDEPSLSDSDMKLFVVEASLDEPLQVCEYYDVDRSTTSANPGVARGTCVDIDSIDP